jgi:transcriptional regulator with XRE-family HTH domain
MSTRIREFRKLRGMTLHALAKQVGTTAQTIQRLETGNMTVSLDWLMRIADVFGMPAAALLVSDTTASVPILGDLDATGLVTPPPAGDPATALSLVIAAPHPVAVHVAVGVQPHGSERGYHAGCWLIGGKADLDVDSSMEPRDCLVATSDGRIVLQRASVEAGRVIHDRLGISIGPGFSDTAPVEVSWIAPVLMAVRYF